MGVGNVWGTETTLWSGSSTGADVNLASSTFSNDQKGKFLRFYITDTGTHNLYLHEVGGWTSFGDGNYSSGGSFFHSDGSYFEFELTTERLDFLTTKGLAAYANSPMVLTKITIYSEDAFLNGPRAGYSNLSLPISVSSASDPVPITEPANWPSIDAKYVRWYVVKGTDVCDITGNETTKPHLTGLTGFTTDADHGSYWHSSTATASLGLAFPMLTVPSGESVEDYQVVAILSTEEGTVSGSDLTKEPLYDVVYTFSFELPFRGDVSSATKEEKTFTITESKKTQTLTMAFDIANDKITLTDASDNELGTATVDASSFWSAIGSSLSGSQPFYVRWFLQDKSGAEATSLASAGAIVDGGSGLYAAPAKDRYGLYFSTANGTNALNDIMKIQVDGSKVSDLAKYDLVCTIATDLTGEVFDVSSKLTHEPNTMVLKYVLKFEDAPWAGTLASDAFTHSKELLIPSSSTTDVTIPLQGSLSKILSEYGYHNSSTGLGSDTEPIHIRWTVLKKNTLTGTYEKISDSESYLNPITDKNHKKKEGYGLYWNTGTNYDEYNNHHSPLDGNVTPAQALLNINFTKPSEGDWKDYRVMVVMSKDLSGQTVAGDAQYHVLENEPTQLDMVYYYNFFVEGDFQFVHYKGASGRDYISAANDSRISGSETQYGWYNPESAVLTASELNSVGELNSGITDFRQGVHTVEYDIFVDATSEELVPLQLPLFGYMGDASSIEPAAYFRWYDWETDMNDQSRLRNVGNELIHLTGSETTEEKAKKEAIINRGWFMMNNSHRDWQVSHNGTHGVGVSFYPKDLTGTKVIACDVSKYYDGIYTASDNSPYLMHEPTISVRYIFNVRPATECASAIKSSDDKFTSALAEVTGGTAFSEKKQEMFSSMFEENGRVVVSFNSQTSAFVLRANLPVDNTDKHIANYYIEEGSSVVKATDLEWYAYYEDDKGIWAGSTKLTKAALAYQTYTTDRICPFTLESLYDTYTLVGGSDTKTFNSSNPISNGMKFHLVGKVKAGSVSKAFSHYELQFFSSTPLSIAELKEASNKKRTDEFMENEMELQSVVDFNDKIKYEGNDDMREPVNENMNYATMPMEWDEAHYGYCYTSIDDYRLPSGSGNNDTYGITPLHGDYILLKSMNIDNVSNATGTNYNYNVISSGWWNTAQLYDYTATMYNGSKGYGTFYYTDASDESRTIATLDFNANLCTGSELAFTIMVADMTETGHLSPQVMATVYALNDDNTRGDRIISFLSCELNSVCAGTLGTWYQIYGRGVIPEGVTLTGKYVVEVDNYSRNTYGADYCVDELRFYTSTGKLKVEQTGGACLDDDLQLTTYIAAEQLESKFATPLSSSPTTIYYRIFKKTSADNVEPISYEAYSDASIYGNGGNDYGQVTIYKPVLNEEGTALDNTTTENQTRNAGYYFGTDGVLYFKIIDDKVMNLEGNNNYFFSLTKTLPFTHGTPSTSKDDWANPNDACDVFSNFFVPRKMAVDFTSGGSPVSNVIGAGCGGGTPSVTEYQLILKVPDASEASGFKTYNSETEGITFTFYQGATAAEALTNAQNGTSSISSGTSTFTYSGLTSGTNYFVAVPSTTTLSDSKTICGYIPFSFVVANAGPNLVLGFSDVTYPDGYERVIRIGAKQLDNLKSNSYILHVPVQSFKDKNGNTANDILLEDHFTLYGTTDPLIAKASGKTYEVETTTTKVAEFVNTKDSKPIVNTTYMYLPLNFANNAVTFHEGFEYKIHTTFCDVNDMSDAGACHPDLYLIIKVVPEYVTWNDEGTTVTPNTNEGTNWSNDANWSRSSKAELYSTTYQDNTDINASLTPTPATYVPMKFTYVTIPTGNVAPKLINLTKATNGLYNNIGATATTNIQYDMMVKVENECDHGVSGDIYDCEKFYSNICKEIYFKPSAELINQQYLTYEKAWVEKEMTSNTWYLMSTPLRDTYAGDMFVPLSATATKNGRQETEAFQAITFPDQADATYSRTKYPIYQRSWGSTFGSTVRVASNDNYRTDYSAKLQSSAVTETAFANWGHSFNDVQEPYTTRTAFAIRAHKKTQGTAALIRLPKTNTTYNYFDWKDTNPTVDPKTSGVKTVTKDGYGKLLVDKDQNATQFEVDVATLQSVGGYVLVGNPYMASIDMTSFLAANSLTGYWTYEGSTVTAMTDGKIRPLQGFFVKKESGNITFTPTMMVDGNHTTDTPAPAREFTLTASSNRGQSAASISVGEETKSVETLFDSNLADVPVVYTVAEGRAVSINKVEELTKPIAFGVNCNSNDMVEVTFSDIERLTDGEVFVVDAVDGKTQQIYEGDTFTVQPNDYGRYFLTFGGVTSIETTLPTQDGTEGEKVIFDLQGRRVIYPGKGVYIVNGKKVVYK